MNKNNLLLDSLKIDYEKLSNIVKCVMNEDSFCINQVSAVKLGGGTVGEIFHCYGSGQSDYNDQHQKFNVILKKIHRWKRFGDPESWNREARLYQSGIFSELPENMMVPECYEVCNVSDDEVHLWLEYIDGMTGNFLIQDDYKFPAYHLGQFHGSLKKRPDYSWLSSRFTPIIYAIQWGTGSIDWMLNEGKNTIPLNLQKRILRVWNKRDDYMKQLLDLPTTLCHRDYYYQNVFVNKGVDEQNSTTVIDWDTSGIGVMGEDIADFTLESLFDMQVKVTEAAGIKKMLISNYITGLREAGWRGKDETILIGYASTVTLHWLFRAIYYLSDKKNEETKNRFLNIIKFCLDEAEYVRDMS